MQSFTATERQQTLLCPFDPRINPHADWVQASTSTWARHYNLLRLSDDQQRFSRWQYGILMARAYPVASRDILSVIADWNTWLFLLDDQFDEGLLGHNPGMLSEYCAHVVAILRGEASVEYNASPALRVLYDVARRLRTYADAPLVEQLVGCLENSFSASVWEARNRACSRIPSEAEYRHYRPFTGAVYCYLTLIELGAAARLPDYIRNHPVLQNLTTMTNNIICWSNDVHSFPREHANGNVHNLITVVQHERNIPVDLAVDYVIDLHNQEVAQFQQLRATMPHFGSFTIAAEHYVQGLEWWIRANMDWSATTTRYR